MAETKWMLRGSTYVHCNCDFGCPCQFLARPTHGTCYAVACFDVEEGVHGTTRLDGLRFAIIVHWPGAIHEGHGEVQPIVDEHANPAQREAILRIMSGLDTEPGATLFQVFSTTFEKVHDPIFARIEFELDPTARRVRFRVPALIDSKAEAIRNPVTGEAQIARINLPRGFEYDVCDVVNGGGEAHGMGPLAFTLQDTHAHFAKLHMTESGVVH